MLAVLPESEEQVRAIVTACARATACRSSRAARAPAFRAARSRMRDGVLLVLSRMRTRARARSAGAHRDRRAGRAQPRTFPKSRHRTASSTRPIRRASRSAPSAATWRRTRAACIASSTGSPRTTCSRCAPIDARRRRDRAGQRRARCAGLRPAGAAHRQRRQPRRRHAGHRAPAAAARAHRDAARRLPQRARRRPRRWAASSARASSRRRSR